MTPPFRRILIPYDGSEPSERALAFAMLIGRDGAAIDIVHVVDASAAMAQSSSAAGFYDPTPVIEAMEAAGQALIEAASARCRAEAIEVSAELVRERPVNGILAAAQRCGDELIVLGTHARSGLPRTVLGSTTEGVLRAGRIPVLAISPAMTAHDVLFRKVVVAVDDSDPADAAAALAGRLSRTLGTRCVICSVVDSRDLYEKAATYGYDPTSLADEMRAHAADVADRARMHADFDPDATSVAIVEDEPARGVIEEAVRQRADAIVMGSHGRRGVQRLFLGSIAEHVLRHSPVPVLVVREKAPSDRAALLLPPNSKFQGRSPH